MIIPKVTCSEIIIQHASDYDALGRITTKLKDRTISALSTEYFECLTEDQHKEIARRSNIHEDLINSLQEMVEIVGGNFCQNMDIKRKYKVGRELLEKCK